MADMQQDLDMCLKTLAAGGLILYPTDTVWALGCDATNDEAVARLLALKGVTAGCGLIVIVPGERELLQYAAQPNPLIFDEIANAPHPVTVIYDAVIGLSDLVLANDGSAAIRISADPFNRHLLKRFRKPLVAAVAGKGNEVPVNFKAIDPALLSGVDHVVEYRQNEAMEQQPSSIRRYDQFGNSTIVRN